MGETVVIPETTSRSAVATPWQVVLHDDPINYIAFVTLVIQRVFGYPRARAEKHTMEVHHLGRSVVWAGEREKAEHYMHQLQAHHLTATIEKSDAPA